MIGVLKPFPRYLMHASAPVSRKRHYAKKMKSCRRDLNFIIRACQTCTLADILKNEFITRGLKLLLRRVKLYFHFELWIILFAIHLSVQCIFSVKKQFNLLWISFIMSVYECANDVHLNKSWVLTNLICWLSEFFSPLDFVKECYCMLSLWNWKWEFPVSQRLQRNVLHHQMDIFIAENVSGNCSLNPNVSKLLLNLELT